MWMPATWLPLCHHTQYVSNIYISFCYFYTLNNACKNSIFKNGLSTYTDASFWDMPYGFGLFPHDNQVTGNMVSTALKQIDAINSRDKNVVMLMHKAADSKLVQDVFEVRQYIYTQAKLLLA